MEEINPEENRKWQRWKATAVEWLAVIISSASAMVSIIAMFVTAICVGIIWSQQSRIDGLESQIARETEKYLTKYNITQTRIGRLENWLKAHGIPIEEIYDDLPDE